MEGDWDQWMADDPEEVEHSFIEEPDLATHDEAHLFDEPNSEFLDGWLGDEDQLDARPLGTAIDPGKPPKRPRPLRSPFVYHLTSLTNFENIVADAVLKAGGGESVGDLERCADRGSYQVFTSRDRWEEVRSFVGFYFTPRTPMMWDVVRKPFANTPPREELVILAAKLVPLALNHEFVFTDGHSQSRDTRSYNDLAALGAVDFDLMRRSNWDRQTEQRPRQAEFLVAAPVPLKAIDAICTVNEKSASIVHRMTGGSVRVVSNPSRFFIPR